MVKPKAVSSIAGIALLLIAGRVAGAGGDDDYAANLGALYGERFAIQAYKDVCIGVLPKRRREFQDAYDAWLARHEEVVRDLELRVAAMVKGLSRDQAEYQQNYSKYHDAVMRQRESEKAGLRKLPRDDLLRRCEDLSASLRGPEFDMYNTHPQAFNAIYGKKQP